MQGALHAGNDGRTKDELIRRQEETFLDWGFRVTLLALPVASALARRSYRESELYGWTDDEAASR